MKFLTSEPALLLGRSEKHPFKGVHGKTKALVIADLHLGIEYEFYKSGIRIPSQLEKITERIEKLLKLTKAGKLIILGDVKHKVPGLSWQELREVPEFINKINRKIPVEIVPGNHDPGLSGLIPNIKIHPASGFLLGDCWLMHGHAWPGEEFLKAKYVILGHNHPVIEFRDKLGYVWREPVWVRAELNKKKIGEKYRKVKTLPEIIIMPVFNEFAGGISLNSKERSFSGPLGRCAETGKAEIYLLDGTFLGELGKL